MCKESLLAGLPMTAHTTEAQALREALASEIADIILEGGALSPRHFADRLLATTLAQAEDDRGWKDTLRYCERQWQDERGVMLDKIAAAETDAAAACAQIDRLRAALTLLLPFVDFAAGEGLELVPDPDDAGSWMDAADLCVAAAKALDHECGDPDYVALLAAGHEAIRSALAPEPQGGVAMTHPAWPPRRATRAGMAGEHDTSTLAGALAYLRPDPASNGSLSLRTPKAREAVKTIEAEIDALRSQDREDGLVAFAREIIGYAFEGMDADGDSIQALALTHGLLNKTTYDPERHGPSMEADPGDEWYEFAGLLAALTPTPPSQDERSSVEGSR